MTPPRVQQLLQQGLAHHQAGRLAQAESLYRQVRAAAPRLFDGLNLSGVLAYQQGRYTDAIALLRTACQIDPRSPVSRFRYGVALAATGQHAEAIPQFKQALHYTPGDTELLNSLAFSLRAVGQIAEARAAYEKAIQLKPDYYEAIDRLGALIADTCGMPAGIPYFRRVIELKPNHAPAWGNLGLALSADGKHGEAIEAFDRAIKLDPKLAQARVGRALAFQQSYRIAEAAAEFAAVLAEHPDHHEARAGRLLTLNYISGPSRQQMFEEHLAFGRAAHTGRQTSPTQRQHIVRKEGRRLRLAFLSPDLRYHSIAYFIEPLLRHLDRTRFEVVLYHDHFQVDAMSERLRALADLWRNFVGQPHDTVEHTIRADAPDILVDLAGHTGLSRLPVFARRVAPVQVSYLGYPNTTGLSEMDYRFVDAVTDPGPEDDRYHTEKLVRFSSCAWAYQPPATAPEPQRAGATSATGSQPVVFGSFNNFAKVSPATLDLWRGVLAAVPHSQLVLKGHGLDDPATAEFVRTQLKGLVDDPWRIRLFGRTHNLAEHLSLYSEVDIALDCHPYNGTTTTCEALWMGVPVVALYGDRHASRVSASLLTAAGHPEWIAHDEADYVRIATSLSQDAALRASLRTGLREDMSKGPLLDHAGQAHRFGEALLRIAKEREGSDLLPSPLKTG